MITMDETNGIHSTQLAGTFPSVRACAEFCGVSERHLRTQITRNQFPHIRLGRRIILPRNAVIEWLNQTASKGVLREPAAEGDGNAPHPRGNPMGDLSDEWQT